MPRAGSKACLYYWAASRLVSSAALKPSIGERVGVAAVQKRIVRVYFGIDDSILFTATDEDLQSLLARLEIPAREHWIALSEI